MLFISHALPRGLLVDAVCRVGADKVVAKTGSVRNLVEAVGPRAV